MKKLILKYSIGLSLMLLTACSTTSDVSPSQNDALNSVSNSDANNNKGSMQGLLDDFLAGEWAQSVENDEEIQKKYIEDDDKPFTLQEYADKRAAYIKANPSDHNNSHVHKINNMPIIGNTRKR